MVPRRRDTCPIDLSELPIDMFACPGHKGLMGPLGTGVLVLRAEVAEWLRTWREGGTGSASETPHQPQFLPDKFEPGSYNAVGLAGLGAAVRWILERGVQSLREHEMSLCRRMVERIGHISRLRWFGPRRPEERVGVFSVRIEDREPDDVSAVLEGRFGILARSGLHCAPLAHAAIGTHAHGGTTRLSFGPFQDVADVDAAADALAEITRGATLPAQA